MKQQYKKSFLKTTFWAFVFAVLTYTGMYFDEQDDSSYDDDDEYSYYDEDYDDVAMSDSLLDLVDKKVEYYFQNKEYDSALMYLEGIENYAFKPKFYTYLAIIYRAKNDYEKLCELLQEEKIPENFDSLDFYKGLCYYYNDQMKKASYYFLQSEKKLKSGLPYIYHVLSELEDSTGVMSYGDMLENINKALQKGNQNFETQINAVYAYYSLRKYDEAHNLLLKLNAKFPNSHLVNYYLGYLFYYQYSNLDSAFYYFKKAYELHPTEEYFNFYFLVSKKMGKQKQINEMLDTLIENSTDQIYVYYINGLNSISNNNWETAIADFTTYLEEGGEKKEAFYYLALAWYNIGNSDLAQTYLDSLFKYDDISTEIWSKAMKLNEVL